MKISFNAQCKKTGNAEKIVISRLYEEYLLSMRKRQSNCKEANVLKNILYKIGCSIGQAVYEKNTQGSFTHRNRKNGNFKHPDTCGCLYYGRVS